ncbi:S-adenosyl-L-methionine-dependent methyltransferase [Endogone sp. FLAS-F59071]|nr:S-adenosyl-L-methionine-dependent methyltransferase [Endogone sp. FLAS-F59071]|eukprot:RUS15742.1 S-adenosyl-L-methionine-dependent methyltransferase [Endogone sp. FLAS-F59071]
MKSSASRPNFKWMDWQQTKTQLNVYNDGKEIERLQLQHWLLKLALDGNFEAPIKEMLENNAKVLEIGCGPGTWSMEMATEYPRSEFIGIDISSDFPSDCKPHNCNFLVSDFLAPLPFEDTSFDCEPFCAFL